MPVGISVYILSEHLLIPTGSQPKWSASAILLFTQLEDTVQKSLTERSVKGQYTTFNIILFIAIYSYAHGQIVLGIAV